MNAQAKCSGWILAGGAGRRIGTPKALLRLRGRSLVARSAHRLQQSGIPATVLGPLSLRAQLARDGLPMLPILPDANPGDGPLPAIFAALQRSRTEWNLIVACDYPLLSPQLLSVLLDSARASNADAVIPLSPEGYPQPLCGVYRRRIRRRFQRMLGAGVSRVFEFLHGVSVELLPWCELTRAGCRRDALMNLNRPEQWRALQRRA